VGRMEGRPRHVSDRLLSLQGAPHEKPVYLAENRTETHPLRLSKWQYKKCPVFFFVRKIFAQLYFVREDNGVAVAEGEK